MQPQVAFPKERERALSATHTEVRFVATEDMKGKLAELRCLLGPQGKQMSLAELVDYMADVSIHALKVKKFGKKRVTVEDQKKLKSKNTANLVEVEEVVEVVDSIKTPKSELRSSKNIRHIPRSLQHHIWIRDRGKCGNCGSQKNLNIDHVKPVRWVGTQA